MRRALLVSGTYLSGLLIMLLSCREDYSIKPPSKLRLDFPKQEYVDWRSQAGYTSQLSKNYQVACLFERNSLIQVGDIVTVRNNVLKGKGDELGKKLNTLGISISGRVVELVKGKKILIEIDLGEEEIEISGVKKNKFNLLLNSSDILKISQFEPFDIVEKVNFNNLNGELMLHHKRLSPTDSIHLLTKLVVSNVESHKFKSERIDKSPIANREKRMFGYFYELEGDMATNFQFYLTDSISQFVWGQVLMDFQAFHKEGIPKDADTKARIMDYIKKDLEVFIENFSWKK